MNSNPMSHRSNNSPHVPVYLNVYDFWPCFNKVFDPIGVGVYHTGVQLFDDQYMFFGFDGDETGVGFIEPFQAAYEFKQQILLGYAPLTFFQFDDKVLDPLRIQFTGNKYDLLRNNCNHFARRLTKQLNVDQKFPKKIFRITDCCNLFRCCIPQCILNGRLDWFNQSSQGQNSSYDGYYQLQESVKDQIDMKMIQERQKQRQKEIQQQILLRKKKELVTTPTSQQPQRKSQNLPILPDNLHHQVPKHNTLALKKGVTPHLENAHQRASLNQLPNLSPKSLGSERPNFQQHIKKKPQPYQKYPKQQIKIFLSDKKKQQTHSQQ